MVAEKEEKLSEIVVKIIPYCVGKKQNNQEIHL